MFAVSRARRMAVLEQGGGAAPPWYLASGVTPLAAYNAKGAATYAASKVNLANPGTYDLTDPVAPSWAAGSGWTFTGSEYLRTGITPTATQTIIIQVTNTGNPAGNHRFPIGVLDDGPVDNFEIDISADATSNVLYWADNGTTRTTLVSTKFTAGNLAMVIGNNGYRDGILDSAALGAPAHTLANQRWTLGCESFNNTLNRGWEGVMVAAAVYATQLTAGQVASVAAAMAAL